MTIAGALSNALSGLTAVTRAAVVVSSNVANANTDGYGRREIELTARTNGGGGGVQVVSVRRMVDQTLLADRRGADAGTARAQVKSDFMSDVLDSVGETGSGLSLGDRIADLEAALVDAAAAPESGPGLNKLVDALGSLTGQMGDVSDQIQTQRSRADAGIADAVTSLNSLLSQIEKINIDVRRQSATGESPNALLDQRQTLVDQVSELVPVREVDRGNGVIALMSEGGMLLDGPAPALSFSQTPLITANHSLAGGTLSGISVNGRAQDMTRDPGLLSGGKLQGLFEVRDTLAPEAQTELDGLARDLVERFEAPGVDPTRALGSPGLLTDQGSAFSAANEVGLAGRLEINALVDPSAGGAVWRLRDGLGATTPGDEGQAAILQNLSDALSGVRATASGGYLPGTRTASGLAAEFASAIGGGLDQLDGTVAYSRARSDALTEEALADGVDTDQEMQNLLTIEQAYKANARVIEAVESMLDSLMRI